MIAPDGGENEPDGIEEVDAVPVLADEARALQRTDPAAGDRRGQAGRGRRRDVLRRRRGHRRRRPRRARRPRPAPLAAQGAASWRLCSPRARSSSTCTCWARGTSRSASRGSPLARAALRGAYCRIEGKGVCPGATRLRLRGAAAAAECRVAVPEAQATRHSRSGRAPTRRRGAARRLRPRADSLPSVMLFRPPHATPRATSTAKRPSRHEAPGVREPRVAQPRAAARRPSRTRSWLMRCHGRGPFRVAGAQGAGGALVALDVGRVEPRASRRRPARR